ncbi:MAG TPA: hypothetical protein VMW73_01700 [Spirochaetia bacterium]|nr:hypothetical protein [Spirochaetia bacterium]
MKKLMLLTAVAGAVLLLGSCLQVKTVVNVNKDGSGTVEQTFLMKSELIAMMAGLNSTGDANSQDSSQGFQLFDEKQLRANAADIGQGVTMVKAAPLENDWGKGYDVVYAFKDINRIHVNQNPGQGLPSQMAQVPGETKATQEPDFIRFSFQRGEPDSLTVNLPAPPRNESSPDATGKGSSMSDEDVSMFTQLYGDMSIGVDLVFDGTIVRTNAAFHDAHRVTLMDFQFNALLKNPDFQKELKDGNSAKLSNFQNLAQLFPGLKIEPSRTVQVQFK